MFIFKFKILRMEMITLTIWVWTLRKWPKLLRTFQYSELWAKKLETMLNFLNLNSIRETKRYTPLETLPIDFIFFSEVKLYLSITKLTQYKLPSTHHKAVEKTVSICNLLLKPKPLVREIILDKRKWFSKNNPDF